MGFRWDYGLMILWSETETQHTITGALNGSNEKKEKSCGCKHKYFSQIVANKDIRDNMGHSETVRGCKIPLNKLQANGRQSLQMRNSSLTGDTRAIVQIYLPTTARDSALDRADRE